MSDIVDISIRCAKNHAETDCFPWMTMMLGWPNEDLWHSSCDSWI